jgi:hypothetical protein
MGSAEVPAGAIFFFRLYFTHQGYNPPASAAIHATTQSVGEGGLLHLPCLHFGFAILLFRGQSQFIENLVIFQTQCNTFFGGGHRFITAAQF